VSTGIEGLQPRRLAVASEGDLLDPRLRILEPRLAVPLQAIALLIELNRPVQRRLTLLERSDDFLETLQRRLKAHLADVCFSGSHGRTCGPRDRSNQATSYWTGVFLNGSRMPGTISSRSASSPASASAASAWRACCSRSLRSCSISASRSLSKRVSVGACIPAAFAAFATAASSSR